MRANIPINGLSNDALLEDWLWLLKEPHTVIAMNNFADMFLRDEKGSIQLLNIAWGTTERLAASDAEFKHLATDKEYQRKWFLTDFLTQIECAGLSLSEGQCFGFNKPLKLGGAMEISNLEIAPIPAQVSLQGQLLQQLRDLPPGTKIQGVKIE